MTCPKVINLLSEYLSAALSRENMRRIREHMAGCPACEKFFDSFKAIIARTHELKRDNIPAEVIARLQSFLKSKI